MLVATAQSLALAAAMISLAQGSLVKSAAFCAVGLVASIIGRPR